MEGGLPDCGAAIALSRFTADETPCSASSTQQYAICAISMSIYTSPGISHFSPNYLPCRDLGLQSFFIHLFAPCLALSTSRSALLLFRKSGDQRSWQRARRRARTFLVKKKRELETELEKADQKIDHLVYQLYGITDKEREIIEASL